MKKFRAPRSWLRSLIAWHYTTEQQLAMIVESGVIRPATKGVPSGERSAVWFSLHPEWEPTASKSYMGADRTVRSGTRETTERFFGLGRVAIALATAPIDWVEFRRVSGVDPKMAKGMAVAAWDAQSDPELWRVSFEPVEREAWLSVERWDGARWVAIEPRRAA